MKKQSKAYQIINASVSIGSLSTDRMSKTDALCQALYVSAKGTKHFYEALELICQINELYREEFEQLKAKYD